MDIVYVLLNSLYKWHHMIDTVLRPFFVFFLNILKPSGQCGPTYAVFRQCHITRHLCRVPSAYISRTSTKINY